MPIPRPASEEPEKEFIIRCMGDETMTNDYPESDQRLAVCNSQWENREGKSMDIIERKTVTIELDDATEGSFVARIATLNVIDKDGDVTLPGAFPSGKEILVSAYMHGSWMGTLPVGKAVIKESGEDVLAEGQFNLKSDIGKEHYETVKFSGGLTEWSYGFKVLAEGSEKELETWATDHDGARPVRILKKNEPIEISPVLLGAGIDTATLAIKNDKTTYADQAEAVLAAVVDMVTRTKSLADLRLKEGRVLSSANRDRMKKLLELLSGVASDLKELLDATEPVDQEKLAQAVLLYTKIRREFMEVI